MSYVTNVVLTWGVLEEDDADVLRRVNRYFAERGEPGFVSVHDPTLPDGWYGGTKYLECGMAIGAFNYLSLSDLVEHLRSLAWEEPDAVQLLLKKQEDERFRLLDVFGADWYPRTERFAARHKEPKR